MTPEQSIIGCSTCVSLLRAEVQAWTAYWDAAIEKTLAKTEIVPLKECAYGTTAALKTHTESCPACQKLERRRWYWPEDNDGTISIKSCTDSDGEAGVVLRHTITKMPENDQPVTEAAQLHADAKVARLKSVESQLALGFTFCEMAKTEIKFGEFEQARKLMAKLRHSSDTIRFHLQEKDHLPPATPELQEKMTKLEASIGEVEELLRHENTHPSPAKASDSAA
jgi:hypothetical protein